jgi:hypothetical protein
VARGPQGIRGLEGDQGDAGDAGIPNAFDEDAWDSGTAYSRGLALIHDGNLWVAVVDNTNVEPGTDANTWAIIAARGAKPWNTPTVWATATVYTAGDDYTPADAVTNDGNLYVCIVSHTSGASTEPGTGVDWEDKWVEIVAPLVSKSVIDALNVDADTLDGHDSTAFAGQPGVDWEQIGNAAAAGDRGEPVTIGGDSVATINLAAAHTNDYRIVELRGKVNLEAVGTTRHSLYLRKTDDAGANWTNLDVSVFKISTGDCDTTMEVSATLYKDTGAPYSYSATTLVELFCISGTPSGGGPGSYADTTLQGLFATYHGRELP